MPSESTVIRNYEEAYLICRAFRVHAWIQDEHTKKKREGVGTHIVVWACGRCNMVRIDSFSHVTGDLLSRAYRPPEGYKLDFKPTLMNLRREFFLREDREKKHITKGSKV